MIEGADWFFLFLCVHLSLGSHEEGVDKMRQCLKGNAIFDTQTFYKEIQGATCDALGFKKKKKKKKKKKEFRFL